MDDEEIWLPVPSKPGLRASSWGRIWLPEREAQMPYGGTRRYVTKPVWGVIRRSHPKAKHAYRGVYTQHMGNIRVHQAVCEAFHGPRPDCCTDVLHIDENALNNRPENLRWGTRKENMNAPGHLAYCARVCADKMAGRSPD